MKVIELTRLCIQIRFLRFPWEERIWLICLTYAKESSKMFYWKIEEASAKEKQKNIYSSLKIEAS